MEELTNLEDRRVEAYLTPLRELTPVAPKPRTSGRAPRRRAIAAGVLVLLALAIGGGAFAGGLFSSRAMPDRSPVSAGGDLACSNLIGMDARRAATILQSRRQTVSWRMTKYVDPARNGGVIGFASEVASPPPGSIVEDVATDDAGLVVFLRRADDANAPPLVTRRC